MIQWRPLRLSDKPLIDVANRASAMVLSDYNFTNLWIWDTVRHYEIAEIEGFCCIKWADLHLFPLGKGDPTSAIEKLAHESELFKMYLIPEEGLKYLKNLSFSYELKEDPPLFDYVYSFEELLNLKGHDYQSKRNQIHQFEGSYDYEYLPVDKALIPKIQVMIEKWFKSHPDETGYKNERVAILRLLDDFDALQIQGGALIVFDEVIACCFGEAISDDTLVIHIEKADISIKGAYQAIHWLFLKNGPAYSYVNREETVGNEGLQLAKESYHPLYLLKKFAIKKVLS